MYSSARSVSTAIGAARMLAACGTIGRTAPPPGLRRFRANRRCLAARARVYGDLRDRRIAPPRVGSHDPLTARLADGHRSRTGPRAVRASGPGQRPAPLARRMAAPMTTTGNTMLRASTVHDRAAGSPPVRALMRASHERHANASGASRENRRLACSTGCCTRSGSTANKTAARVSGFAGFPEFSRFSRFFWSECL